MHADEKAISSFSSRLLSGEHIPALMGVYGLGSETISERLYGAPLYPSVDELQKRQKAQSQKKLPTPSRMFSPAPPSIQKSDNKYAAYSEHVYCSPPVTSGVIASHSRVQSRI